MNNLHLVLGDISQSTADIIVNAANGTLLGGGGVDGAIHSAAGPELLDYCQHLPDVKGIRCPTGEAILTPGFKLNAKHIIHTVGPIYHRENKSQSAHLLASCYQKCLHLACKINAKSIAFPAISTGVYRYPMAEAADIAIHSCLPYSDEFAISFYLFDHAAYNIWQTQLAASTSS